MMKYIHTKKAPKAVGPYSQAIVVHGFIYCAGQIGIDPKTNELVDGLEKQTHQLFSNIKAVLEEAGSDLDHVVKTTIFLKDIADYAKVNELYGTYFTIHKPARSAVAVASLPKDALIEIEVIAVTQ
jgi:2-iminobutanoate/2-iminopropanoate deaminase